MGIRSWLCDMSRALTKRGNVQRFLPGLRLVLVGCSAALAWATGDVYTGWPLFHIPFEFKPLAPLDGNLGSSQRLHGFPSSCPSGTRLVA